MKKRAFYTEISYLLGIIILAIGTAMMERANLGVSMVVAPAYLLYLKINPMLPFFSFGMAEYMLQLVILLAMMLVLRRVKLSWLFSFATAVLYGLALDGAMALIARIPGSGMAFRIAFFLLGMVVSGMGVSLFFHTYLPPEAYELFVKEISARFGIPLYRFKTIYDCASCLIAVIMSFAFFGFGVFQGVKWGTVFCALVNGWVIGRCTRALDYFFDFKDGTKLRSFFL